MKIYQKTIGGFVVVELLILLIVAAVIAGGAYYVGKNHSNEAAQSSDQAKAAAIDPTAGWSTHTGDTVKYVPDVIGEGDGVNYSFKYPSSWKFEPIGTASSAHPDAPNGFQQVIASGSSDGLIFRSGQTTLGAQAYYESIRKSAPGVITGPDWQGVSGFTTKKGYSAYTAKLDASYGTTYETYISNGNGVVVFSYGTSVKNTADKVFDTVIIP